MRAITKVERKSGGIQVLDIPPPMPKDDEVLVQIHYAAICGSDLHAYHFSPTHHYIQPPIIMGHEGAGEVISVGSAVTGFKPGDRVVFEAVVYCGKCESCLKGNHNLCYHFQVRGMHQNGLFTEFVSVTPNYLHKIPDTLPLEKACLVEPLAVAAYAVLDRSTIKAGDLVLITGPGPIGLLSAQMVKIMGAEPVVVGIDSDEAIRLPIARDLGYQTINLSKQNIQEELNKLYGRGTVERVVECSGASTIFQTSLELVAKGGSITLVGLFSNLVEADLTIAVRKEITIYTSCAYDWVNFERAIRLLDQGKIGIEPLISFYNPEYAVTAFEDALAKKVSKPVFRFK